jgi:hypothetical protein
VKTEAHTILIHDANDVLKRSGDVVTLSAREVGFGRRPETRDMSLETRLRGPAVELKRVIVAEGSEESPWNVVAYEVALKGRGDVKLTRQDFEQVVRNFQRYPRIPVVLQHADTAEGGHPDSAKAHGWITELRVGEFVHRGKKVASLDARFTLNDATRAEVNAEPPAWAFCSITIVQNGRDEETGERVGSFLYSLSLTNNPALQGLDRIAASDERGTAAGKDERTMKTFLMLAALLGITAATEEEAQEKIFASAKDLSGLRTALGLPASASLADAIAKVTALSTDAAKVAGLEQKLSAFETEREERLSKERKEHVDAWIAVDPKTREPARAALEAFADADYERFSKKYPKPSAAELKARVQDQFRFERVTGRVRSAPAREMSSGADASADDIISTAHALQHEAASRGEELSFEQATELAAQIVEDGGAVEPVDADFEDDLLEGEDATH